MHRFTRPGRHFGRRLLYPHLTGYRPSDLDGWYATSHGLVVIESKCVHAGQPASQWWTSAESSPFRTLLDNLRDDRQHLVLLIQHADIAQGRDVMVGQLDALYVHAWWTLARSSTDRRPFQPLHDFDAFCERLTWYLKGEHHAA